MVAAVVTPKRGSRRSSSVHSFATQRERDDESSLMYFRARSYDPRLGRFVQKEPMLGSRVADQYLYARNNPVSAGDPTGEHLVVFKSDPDADRALGILKVLYGESNLRILENRTRFTEPVWQVVVANAQAAEQNFKDYKAKYPQSPFMDMHSLLIKAAQDPDTIWNFTSDGGFSPTNRGSLELLWQSTTDSDTPTESLREVGGRLIRFKKVEGRVVGQVVGVEEMMRNRRNAQVDMTGYFILYSLIADAALIGGTGGAAAGGVAVKQTLTFGSKAAARAAAEGVGDAAVRFVQKSPSGADKFIFETLETGATRIFYEVPAAQIAGSSRAIYMKYLSPGGFTQRVIKWTLDAQGNLVHVKVKF